MNEKALIKRLKSGDTEALGKIVTAYSDYVRTVARNFSRGMLSGEDIDEIVSDVFFNLWRRRESIDGELGLRPYLSSSVRNAAKNRFKAAPPLSGDISELDLPSPLDVIETAEREEMMKALDDGLKTLSEEDREIFFRFYFYGEKTPEISKTKGLPENTVSTKLRRTKEKLKKYLNERGFEYV